MMTNLDYFYDDTSSSYLMPCFYGGCINSSKWMGSGLGCGMAAMDNVVSCLVFFFDRHFFQGTGMIFDNGHWKNFRIYQKPFNKDQV